MGAYKYIRESFQQEYRERPELLRQRIVAWSSESSVLRIARPTNIARARELGYKAKPGIIMTRVRIKRGSRKRLKPSGGRKPSKSGRFFVHKKSLQSIAEERSAAKFTNCEVVNSYYVGETGTHKFFEVILADRAHPSMARDKFYGSITAQRGRASRGLTSSGKKHRGLVTNNRSPTYRPSVRSRMRST